MAGRPLDFHVFIRIWHRKVAARWRFDAVDPHHTFHMLLERLPDGCEHGAWTVHATWNQRDPLVYDTEAEARAGYHDEALRIQRLAGPGRWVQLDPQ